QELLGALHLDRRRTCEVGAERQLLGGSADHRLVGVTQSDRAQPHAVLDELVAVHVPGMTALAAHDERRCTLGELVIALGVGVRPAGNDGAGPPRECLAALEAGAAQRAGGLRSRRSGFFAHRTLPHSRSVSGTRCPAGATWP